jgi:hypothetical protein
VGRAEWGEGWGSSSSWRTNLEVWMGKKAGGGPGRASSSSRLRSKLNGCVLREALGRPSPEAGACESAASSAAPSKSQPSSESSGSAGSEPPSSAGLV